MSPNPVNVSSNPNTVPTLSGKVAAVIAKLAVPLAATPRARKVRNTKQYTMNRSGPDVTEM